MTLRFHPLLASLLLLFSLNAKAQFTSVNAEIRDNLSSDTKIYKGIGLDTVDCNSDTLQYGRFKATTLRAINVSSGYSLGQFYNAPGEVKISGLSFYAWVTANTSDSVEIICRVYEADADSLPLGKLLQTERIKVDSTFGSGLLSVLEKQVVFDSVISTDKPYVLVLESNDTNRVAVVANDWIAGDGERENLASGTVGGTWYRCLNLNIANNTLDCDVLLEPYVSYSLSVDFEFNDCYNYRDSVHFKNKSSAFFFDPMYNRWAFSNNERFSFLWNYGHNFSSYYAEQGGIRYNSPNNYDVRLIGRQLHFSNSGYCIDTMIRELHFRPSEISFTGTNTDSMCTGDSARLIALSNGNVNWYRSANDTAAFLLGETYHSGVRQDNDTLFVMAINAQCSSRMIQKVIQVHTTPSILSVLNDSVCQNSIANLSALPDTGTIRWFTDSLSGSHFHQDRVYSTAPLTSPAKYYVEAWHRGCRSVERKAVQAFVGQDFAPGEPDVVRDTLVCLIDGDISLRAAGRSGDVLRWYDEPSGGTPFQTGEILDVSISRLGRQTFYIDAFDGNCASSRLSINVRTFTFPQGNFNNQKINACEGDSLSFELSVVNGFANWYLSPALNQKVFEGNVLQLDAVRADTTLWFVPTNGICADTNSYQLDVQVHPYGVITTADQLKEACSRKSLRLNASAGIGEVVWFSDSTGKNEVFRGNTFITPPANSPETYYFGADNQGCRSELRTYQLDIIPSANATFDFSIIEPGSFQFRARESGQGFYRWDMGDGGIANGFSVNYSFKENGTYPVTLVVLPQNGCNDTAVREITVSGLVTVTNALANQKEPKAWPNPFGSEINIQYGLWEKGTEVEMYDQFGRVVLHCRSEERSIINTAFLKAGMYYLRLQNEGQQVVIPLMKVE